MTGLFVWVVALVAFAVTTPANDTKRLRKALAGIDQVRVEVRAGKPVIFFEDAMFDVGSTNLKPQSMKITDQVADVLADKFRTRLLYIEGHTDNRGQAALNQYLSNERATRIAERVLAAGYRADNIDVAAYADQYPECSNDTAEGRQCNRRVQIVVIRQ